MDTQSYTEESVYFVYSTYRALIFDVTESLDAHWFPFLSTVGRTLLSSLFCIERLLRGRAGLTDSSSRPIIHITLHLLRFEGSDLWTAPPPVRRALIRGPGASLKLPQPQTDAEKTWKQLAPRGRRLPSESGLPPVLETGIFKHSPSRASGVCAPLDEQREPCVYAGQTDTASSVFLQARQTPQVVCLYRPDTL
ncbi:hypothetical protein NDU88_007010 [Pleurodeles waltl]|uniref:Uncharacterized protein n=1 Tax=Pleurodeles waltl TaxID=8319 RepID=A0AAV7LS35_PLEWA|nr:hypothetical protein NDU88_007010 [Pleurodeles waltl]